MKLATVTLLLLIGLLQATRGRTEGSQPAHTTIDYIADSHINAVLETELNKVLESGKFNPVKELRSSIFDNGKIQWSPLPVSATYVGMEFLYSKCCDSIVIVTQLYKCTHCGKWHHTYATGFLVSENGVFITNYHVLFSEIEGAFYAIMTHDGRVYPVESIVAASKSDDLAVCKVNGTGFKALPLRPNAPVGTSVAVIGHDNGSFYTMTSGIISRYFSSAPPAPGCMEAGITGPRMSITADYAKGSSGSPVLDMNGNVVGMAASTRSIYSNQLKDGTHSNLQMVVKQCIPSGSLLSSLEHLNDNNRLK